MAKYCPEKDGPALYPECLECEDKTCRKDPDKTRNHNNRASDKEDDNE